MNIENNEFYEKKRILVKNLEDRKYLIDQRLKTAFMEIPLEEFIHKENLGPIPYDPRTFYLDRPNVFYFLNEENYRTISAPHMISIMLQGLSLRNADNLLILGAKSGYIAALAHKLAPKGEIIILEANSDVAKITNENLEKLNLHGNITVIVKNPLQGMMELSPWQKILVTGAIKERRIYPLLRQLDEDKGMLYAPIGEDFIQIYTKILRMNKEFFGNREGEVRFTPLMTQVELDELELITDFTNIEDVETINTPSKVEDVSRFEDNIEIKYGTNILDNINIEPPKQIQKVQIDIKQRDIVISYLEKIEDYIKKLKKEENIDNCFSCVEDIETQIDALMGYKKMFGIKLKKIQNFLNQIRTYNIIRKGLEKKEVNNSEIIDKKIEIITKQMSDINELHNLLINEIDRIEKL